jgi:hypothetical protein
MMRLATRFRPSLCTFAYRAFSVPEPKPDSDQVKNDMKNAFQQRLTQNQQNDREKQKEELLEGEFADLFNGFKE